MHAVAIMIAVHVTFVVNYFSVVHFETDKCVTFCMQAASEVFTDTRLQGNSSNYVMQCLVVNLASIMMDSANVLLMKQV